MKPIAKSGKLANVCYDIRGPVLDKARQMEDEGQKIIKLNIGNLAVFGLEPPDEIVQDMIRNLPHSAGYTDSKGLFAPRKAVVHYTQEKGVKGVTVDDVYLGNGASELIQMAINALVNDGDEILIPAPDFPLYTAVVGLSGGRPVHYLCDEGAGWLPDLADIEAKITPRTREAVQAAVDAGAQFVLATGRPPRWVWPRTTALASLPVRDSISLARRSPMPPSRTCPNASFSPETSVMSPPSAGTAPSATTMIGE